jgi:hypothetical protein
LALRAVVAAEMSTAVRATATVCLPKAIHLPQPLPQWLSFAACGAIDTVDAEQELNHAEEGVTSTLRAFSHDVFLDIPVELTRAPTSLATNAAIIAAVCVASRPFSRRGTPLQGGSTRGQLRGR